VYSILGHLIIDEAKIAGHMLLTLKLGHVGIFCLRLSEQHFKIWLQDIQLLCVHSGDCRTIFMVSILLCDGPCETKTCSSESRLNINKNLEVFVVVTNSIAYLYEIAGHVLLTLKLGHMFAFSA
jgi:hypothetical protein